MTLYEHAMVGIDGALALGLHRRWGWPIVAMAACASVLPDWDGLMLCWGARSCYAQGHRGWGHNLLVATLVAAIAAWLAWRYNIITRARAALGRRWSVLAAEGDTAAPPSQSWRDCLAWIAVAMVAAGIHLLGDALFSVGHDLPEWGVPLLWPFSSRDFAWPRVPWGDIGATLILVAGMFAMVRWPRRIRPIAAGTLAMLVGYIALRGCFL